MMIFLAHAPDDEWADLIRRMIGRRHQVVSASQDPARPVGEALAGADGLVVLLSAEYAAGGMAEAIWWLLNRRDGVAVVLHCDNSAVPANLSTFKRFDITGLSIDTLHKAVSDAIGGMAVPSKQPESTTDRDPFRVPDLNPDFRERSALLDVLYETLMQHKIVALRGVNGVGKTDIAVAFALRRFGTGTVAWIDASSEEEVKDCLIEIAYKLGLCGKGASADDAFHALRRNTRHRLLLIFDDVRSAEIFRWLPGRSTYVIATTEANPDGRAHVFDVPVFTRAESTAFIRRHLPRIDVAEAEDLAGALEDHPGQLKHAVTAIRRGTRPKTDYIKVGDADAESAQPAAEVPGVVSLAERLAQSYGKTLDWLRVCAAMQAAPVPLWLFQSGVPKDDSDSVRLASRLEPVVEFLEDVVQLQLGRIEPRTLRDAFYGRMPELRRPPPEEDPARQAQRARFALNNTRDLIYGSFELNGLIAHQIVDPARAELARRESERLLIHSMPESLYDPATWPLWRELELLVPLPPSSVPRDPSFHTFLNAVFATRSARAGAHKVSPELSAFLNLLRPDCSTREETFMTERLLASCENAMGKPERAFARANSVWARRRKRLKPRKKQALEVMLDVALYACELGKTDEARSLLGEADEYIAACVDDGREELVRRSRYVHALVLHKGKNYEDALTLYRSLLDDDELRVRTSQEFHWIRRREALCLLEQQHGKEAVQLLHQLLADLREVKDPGHEDIIAVENDLRLARRRTE